MKQPSPMDEIRFWSIVERARAGTDDDREAVHECLADELRCCSPEDIASFQARMDALVGAAYRWDLWGAAYVLNGGCSDDGFEYFRLWLVSRGRKTYEAALIDPESLATIAERMGAPPDDMIEDETYGYVAAQVYEELRDGAEIPHSGLRPLSEPHGEQFDEDPEFLARRYPRLTAAVARWGH